MKRSEIQKIFEKLYGKPEVVVRSPARINLIGEHTDYNDGFVLPASIDKETWFFLAGNNTKSCSIHAMNFDETITFSMNDIRRADKPWANYILGVVDQLQRSGYQLRGFHVVFGGNIPIGAGLSSSASLVCGLIYSLNELFGLGMSNIDMISLGRKAENEFVGVQCGIMDQFINIMGKKDHALRLDCRSLDYYYFPLKLEHHSIILCNSKVSHSLAGSEYNTRKEECLRGLKIIKENYSDVESLRDVDLNMLRTLLPELGESIFNRCRFVVEENTRVLQSCEHLQQGNIAVFGKNMYESHYGLALEYNVSCPELDFLIGYTIDKTYVLGARMMGGGFGGCTINIIEKAKKQTFIDGISHAYKKRFNIECEIYEVSIVDGSSKLSNVEYIPVVDP